MEFRKWQWPWVFPAAVMLAAFAAHLPVLWNDFVGWDDPINILDNVHYRALTWENIKWMFTAPHVGHYQPLTWLFFNYLYRVWGLNPLGWHLASLLIHVLNAGLFYMLGLRLMRLALGVSWQEDDFKLRSAAALSALLFALHPLTVESVAWATELSIVLCALFYLLTVLFYLAAHADTGDRAPRGFWMPASLTSYSLSLLAKGMGIALPAALVILDVYPLRRLPADPRRWADRSFRKLWLEKLAYASLALPVVVISYVAQRPYGDMLDFKKLSVSFHAALAFYGSGFYLWKTLLPLRLLPLYELPRSAGPLVLPALFGAMTIAALSVAFFLLRRRWPAALAALAFYAVTVSPHLGIIQFGVQIAADRYSYLSCWAWPLLAGALFWKGLGSESVRSRVACLAAAILLPAVLGGLTWRQARVWRDTESLWSYVLANDPGSAIAHNNLAAKITRQGRLEEAVKFFREAVQLNPDYGQAYGNLGLTLSRLGRKSEAVEMFKREMARGPAPASDHIEFAMALETIRSAEAVRQYRRAISLERNNAKLHYNLARLLEKQGEPEKAAWHYTEALRLEPEYAEARNNYGLLLSRRGRFEEAVGQYRMAIKAKPDYALAYYNWGQALQSEGRLDEALGLYGKALSLDPAIKEARLNLANILVRQGKPEEAVEEYRALLKRAPNYAPARENLRRVLDALRR